MQNLPNIVGPPWKEGEIRLEVDKCFCHIEIFKKMTLKTYFNYPNKSFCLSGYKQLRVWTVTKSQANKLI